MHKQATQQAVTSLHDLSAVDLIAGFKAKPVSYTHLTLPTIYSV